MLPRTVNRDRQLGLTTGKRGLLIIQIARIAEIILCHELLDVFPRLARLSPYARLSDGPCQLAGGCQMRHATR